jgi:hypothetical protein
MAAGVSPFFRPPPRSGNLVLLQCGYAYRERFLALRFRGVLSGPGPSGRQGQRLSGFLPTMVFAVV